MCERERGEDDLRAKVEQRERERVCVCVREGVCEREREGRMTYVPRLSRLFGIPVGVLNAGMRRSAISTALFFNSCNRTKIH